MGHSRPWSLLVMTEETSSSEGSCGGFGLLRRFCGKVHILMAKLEVQSVECH